MGFRYFVNHILGIFLSLVNKTNPRIVETLIIRAQRSLGIGFDGGVRLELDRIFFLLGDRKETPLVIFDVGANIGTWTKEALRVFPGAEIHCFEPGQESYKNLTLNFRGEKNIILHKLAVSNQNRIVELYADFPGSGLASLFDRKIPNKTSQFQTRELVQASTLEQICEKSRKLPDILKLDIEGQEFHALSGAKNILSKIKLIQFEFGGTDIDSRVFFRDIWDLLKVFNFEIFRITPHGLLLLEEYNENLEIFIYSNYIAFKNH